MMKEPYYEIDYEIEAVFDEQGDFPRNAPPCYLIC